MKARSSGDGTCHEALGIHPRHDRIVDTERRRFAGSALISLGTWISGNGTNQNNDGVSGKLYAKNITDYDICTILPTGW